MFFLKWSFSRLALSIFVIFTFNTNTYADTETLISLNTRPKVKQTFILIESKKAPVASIILFAGGHGNLKLSKKDGKPNIGWGKRNFLVRTRHLFAQQGFQVAVVDAPSDQKAKWGMLEGFRNSTKHVKDISQVIQYLKNKSKKPVWLVGTSRGTESAAYTAIYSEKNAGVAADGLVLTSSMTVENGSGTEITSLKLDKIIVPTLVVAHNQDACLFTPPQGAERIAKQLTHSSNVKIEHFNGGTKPKSRPCKAMSYHGFLGIEDKVVSRIADFIKNNSTTNKNAKPQH